MVPLRSCQQENGAHVFMTLQGRKIITVPSRRHANMLVLCTLQKDVKESIEDRENLETGQSQHNVVGKLKLQNQTLEFGSQGGGKSLCGSSPCYL